MIFNRVISSAFHKNEIIVQSLEFFVWYHTVQEEASQFLSNDCPNSSASIDT